MEAHLRYPTAHQQELIDDYFFNPIATHKQYELVKRFYIDKISAEDLAIEFGYSIATVYTITQRFLTQLAIRNKDKNEDPFFLAKKPGRVRGHGRDAKLAEEIVILRKQHLSTHDIQNKLNQAGHTVSRITIQKICKDEGFSRLPKRTESERIKYLEKSSEIRNMPAEKSHKLNFTICEHIDTADSVGVLSFLTIIKEYGIDEVIENSLYPETEDLSKYNCIMTFLALKLSNVKRYNNDAIWAHNKALGLFAGLNCLPKTTWLNTYSSGVTREANIDFIQKLNRKFCEHGLLSGDVNLDFTAIPYYGSPISKEHNWSGKLSKSLISFEAAIAQDSQTGLVCYGDATVRHENQNDVILDFVDIYQENGAKINYVIFDSKFTTMKNLGDLNKNGIKFITIQRRCKTLVKAIAAIPEAEWTTVRINKANYKHRFVTYAETMTTHHLYENDELRQIFVKTNHENPAIIITNDKTRKAEDIIRKYSLRWNVENKISEQINFFHMNRNCSDIDIKVDFDFAMTCLANNLYRLFAIKLRGHEKNRPQNIYDNFIAGSGSVEIKEDVIEVAFNKRRRLPILLSYLNSTTGTFKHLGNKELKFIAKTT
jgi:hypothetical protein